MAYSERGYAMAALLVALSVMAIMLGAALPSWRTYVQREKEAELVFRGEQYARAITLFQRRYANASPPNIDVLVNERFLRKKYKDPITGEDFQIISAGGAVPGQGPATDPGGRTGGQQGSQGAQQTLQQVQQRLQQAQQSLGQGSGRAGGQGGTGVGIVGVTSKSSQKSFRLYRGRDTYNEWVFMGVQQSNRAGGPGGAAGQTGTRGGGANRGGGTGTGGGTNPRGGGTGPGGGGTGPGVQQPPGGRGTQPQQPPGRGFGGRNFEN